MDRDLYIIGKLVTNLPRIQHPPRRLERGVAVPERPPKKHEIPLDPEVGGGRSHGGPAHPYTPTKLP